jgi:hypothetical protein
MFSVAEPARRKRSNCEQLTRNESSTLWNSIAADSKQTARVTRRLCGGDKQRKFVAWSATSKGFPRQVGMSSLLGVKCSAAATVSAPRLIEEMFSHVLSPARRLWSTHVVGNEIENSFYEAQRISWSSSSCWSHVRGRSQSREQNNYVVPLATLCDAST